jgi:PRTRC genetic system ThiF family protein
MEGINPETVEALKNDYELYRKVTSHYNLKHKSALDPSMNRIMEFDRISSGWKLETDPIEIIVIGAGGTGGYLIRDLARFLYSVEKRIDNGKLDISILVYDGDIVEEKNILRQNFMPQDIGQNKAEVMATRHTRAFGTNISYNAEMFTSAFMRHLTDKKRIFVGCVDNNAGRREIAKTMSMLQDSWHSKTKDSYWIDSGNEKKSGQVIVGSPKLMDVTDLYPEILLSKHDSTVQVSCADRMLQDEQNMFVNLTASNLILNYIKNIILDIPMATHGTEFNIDNFFKNYYILKK